jgi:hypothetical protein
VEAICRTEKNETPRLTENMSKPEMIFLLGVHQQEQLEAKRAEASAK